MGGGKLLTDQVADEIVRTIREEQLKPGEKLPNEFILAAMLGVGRSTVREAIKILVSRNVVEIRRGSGTYISYRNGVSQDPLGLELLSDRTKVVSDLLELRFMLEPRLASLAATNASEDDMKNISELCDECEHAITVWEDFHEANAKLHAAIAGASGNSVIPNIVIVLCGPESMMPGKPSDEIREQLIKTHREIVNAITARNEVAAHDAMLLHLAVCRRNQEEMALK